MGLQPSLLHQQQQLFLIFFFLFLLPLSNSKTHPGDKEALRRLKSYITPASIPPSSCLATWDFASDPCDSLFSADLFTCGIRCDSNSTTTGLSLVTDLTLDPVGYSGTLSPSIWSFSSLQSFDVSDNRLSGHIPPPSSRVSLPSLRRVALSLNEFEGEIPPAVFSGEVLPFLEELVLDGNRLSGEIPASLGGMRSLKRLELGRNNLTGRLPAELGSLQNLYFLDASDNTVSGAVPATLPPLLVELAMRNNRLEGEIPSEIGSLGYLQVIDLSKNMLSGFVPATLFSNPSLQQLVLSDNRLSLMAAPGWGGGGRSGLVELDLAGNEITGQLPAWVAGMPKLSALSLERNRFTGMIPWVYAAKQLGRLMLAGNYLYGPIPSPLTAMKEGSAAVSLADNCLFRCPQVFFFCHGGEQKPVEDCRAVNPFIP